MYINEMLELKKQGKLEISKTLYRERVRNKYIWDKDYDHIIETKKIPYRVWIYLARTPDMPENQFYRIRKKDYEELLACG